MTPRQTVILDILQHCFEPLLRAVWHSLRKVGNAVNAALRHQLHEGRPPRLHGDHAVYGRVKDVWDA